MDMSQAVKKPEKEKYWNPKMCITTSPDNKIRIRNDAIDECNAFIKDFLSRDETVKYAMGKLIEASYYGHGFRDIAEEILDYLTKELTQ